MTKFGSAFMMKSPFKKHGEEFIKKAKELSKESGTPGDFDRDNPEVLEQLKKAKEAEAEHKGSPAEMKSPLHAPVTATQALTSDMYYQPREQVDYEDMIENYGKLGKAGRNFFGGKKKTDPIDDHKNKVINNMNTTNKKNKENEKWFRENTELKLTKDGVVRVDKNGNIYNPFGQGEAFSERKYPIIGNTNKDIKDFDPTKTLSIMDVKDLKDNKEKPIFKGN